MNPRAEEKRDEIKHDRDHSSSVMTKLKILLADDHVVMREGLRRLIDGESDMEVVCEAADGDEAVQKAAALCPDVAVLDMSMKRMNGADAARRLKRACPDIRVLGLSMHEDASYVREMVDAGASGYILKRAAGAELIDAIRAVGAGGTYVDPRIAGRLLQSLVPRRNASAQTNELSERENDVLRFIAQGFSNKEIAAQLNLSVKTVETYKGRGMEKLGLRTRVDIVRSAATRGWLPG
jgi:DNA-binding NarL/FixJ family response regulator